MHVSYIRGKLRRCYAYMQENRYKKKSICDWNRNALNRLNDRDYSSVGIFLRNTYNRLHIN